MATLDLREEQETQGEAYRPQTEEESRFRLGVYLVWGFIGNISLVLLALLVSILLDRYSEVYLTVLTAVGSVWGGIIGAVVAFYFTKRREETGE